MAEFNTNPDQCLLNMQIPHLIYVFILNIVLIFIPTIGLTVLYIYIIINLRKHYKLFNQPAKSNDNENGLRIHSKNSIRMYKTNNNNNIKRINNEVSKSSTTSAQEVYKSIKSLNQSKQKKSLNTESRGKKSSVFKWNAKKSRSCSFCFSGINSKYECRCEIGNQQEFRTKFLSSKFVKGSLDGSAIVHVKKNKFNSMNNFTHLEPIRFQSLKRSETTYNKVNFTVVISLITLIFFCCQLPIRIFLLWSYFTHNVSPPPMLISDETPIVTNEINFINIISNTATLIYFFHCISNPIIYNLLSIKFRRAFLSLGISHKSCLFKLSCNPTCRN